VLVPSLGPPPVEVPTVIGTTLDEARGLLEAGDLALGNVRRAYHDTAPDGQVIRQSAPAGSEIPLGSTVNVVVSKGHAPVDVPSVVGMPADKATKVLEGAGFHVEPTIGFSERVERDLVMSVNPPEGTSSPYASTVTITVSVGPEEFPAPNFYGLSADQARTLAERWGLELALFTVPGTDGSTVTSQLPQSGTTVRYGATISLYLD
jgi:serine/threonine-protein kinase